MYLVLNCLLQSYSSPAVYILLFLAVCEELRKSNMHIRLWIRSVRLLGGGDVNGARETAQQPHGFSQAVVAHLEITRTMHHWGTKPAWCCSSQKWQKHMYKAQRVSSLRCMCVCLHACTHMCIYVCLFGPFFDSTLSTVPFLILHSLRSLFWFYTLYGPFFDSTLSTVPFLILHSLLKTQKWCNPENNVAGYSDRIRRGSRRWKRSKKDRMQEEEERKRDEGEAGAGREGRKTRWKKRGRGKREEGEAGGGRGRKKDRQQEDEDKKEEEGRRRCRRKREHIKWRRERGRGKQKKRKRGRGE